jgi:ABC-type multidrug transport system ATPase subunit
MLERGELLRLRSVVKSYGKEEVLRVEDLTLGESDTLIATGPNGSGKSTLGRIIAGSVLPSHGSVMRSDLLSRGVLGLMPQHGGLYGELSVEQNLRLRCRLFGIPAPDFGDPLLEDLGILEVLQKKYADLSGGFQRLASLASVLILRPSWLVLDEPLTGLDAEKRQAALAVIDQARANLLLTVIITPNPEEVPDWGDRIMVKGGLALCASH